MSARFTWAERCQLVARAARAPSAHNVQPARWCFPADGSIELLEDRQRLLPAADPAESEHRLALGAAYESMLIAASRLSCELAQPELLKPTRESAGRYRRVAKLRKLGRRSADPQARFADRRTTYRGVFASMTADRELELQRALSGRAGLHLVLDERLIGDLARLHDACSLALLRQPALLAELQAWLRLSRRHPGWKRDGLNAEALRLSVVERIGASVFMQPQAFKFLDACGLAAGFVSEARVSRSAAAMLIMSANAGEDRFEIGRRFYRLWLEITGLGLSACPMSALVDHVSGITALRELVGLGTDEVLVNVFRVGLAPSPLIPTPRLPVEELMIEEGRLDELQELQQG